VSVERVTAQLNHAPFDNRTEIVRPWRRGRVTRTSVAGCFIYAPIAIFIVSHVGGERGNIVEPFFRDIIRRLDYGGS